MRLATGVAAGGEFVPGINETVTLSIDAGAAFVALNGINETITLSLEAGEVFGDVEVAGVSLEIYLGFATEPATSGIQNGINETITLSLVAGVADNGAPEPNIGDAYGGGYFAGYISHAADGVATHRLIVAPRATGATGTGYAQTTMPVWKVVNSATIGSDSTFDGAANSADLVAADINDHPAAKFCQDLSINGFTDWYLPSRLELDIAYFNLKPTTQNNITSWGENAYSVPARTTKYTSGDPAQTAVAAFQSGGSEAFVNQAHWSSTEYWTVSFGIGQQLLPASRNLGRPVRAFRREAI
jgi:hypothetical protein